MCAPDTAACELWRVRLRIKFEIAQYTSHVGPHDLQPLRIKWCLRPHRRQRGEGRTCQPGQALRLTHGFVTEAGIDQHQWHPYLPATMRQVRPDFGFHQDAQIRFEMRQKALYGTGCVPRLPSLQVTRAKERQALGTPGGGAVCQQQPHLGQLHTQGRHQHSGGAGFTQ